MPSLFHFTRVTLKNPQMANESDFKSSLQREQLVDAKRQCCTETHTVVETTFQGQHLYV